MSTLPNILFLTPFHFGTPATSDAFDRLAEAQLTLPDVATIAEHVEQFDPAEAQYDDRQRAAVVEAVLRANDRDIDGIVIACHYDPAVQAARDVSNVPVLAPFELVAGLARQLGPRFAVITDIDEAEDVIAGLARSYGHEDSCVTVKAIGMDGDQIVSDTAAAARAVDAMVVQLTEQHDISSIVIGCTIVGAAYEAHRDEFPDRGVTILNSNALSVRAAALLALDGSTSQVERGA